MTKASDLLKIVQESEDPNFFDDKNNPVSGVSYNGMTLNWRKPSQSDNLHLDDFSKGRVASVGNNLIWLAWRGERGHLRKGWYMGVITHDGKEFSNVEHDGSATQDWANIAMKSLLDGIHHNKLGSGSFKLIAS